MMSMVKILDLFKFTIGTAGDEAWENFGETQFFQAEQSLRALGASWTGY